MCSGTYCMKKIQYFLSVPFICINTKIYYTFKYTEKTAITITVQTLDMRVSSVVFGTFHTHIETVMRKMKKFSFFFQQNKQKQKLT